MRFARRALLTAQPDGFLSRRFADFCTAVTVEVGMPRDVESTERATSFLSRLLTSTTAPDDDPADLALFETTARVLLADGGGHRTGRTAVQLPIGAGWHRVDAIWAARGRGRERRTT